MSGAKRCGWVFMSWGKHACNRRDGHQGACKCRCGATGDPRPTPTPPDAR